MIKLHGIARSNYCNKVKIALLEKGLPFEEVYCMVSQDPAMLARSPMGRIPFLELDDGQLLTESSVILEYLEDMQPNPPLYPGSAAERARIRELIASVELNVELVARRLYAEAFFGGKVSDGTKALTQKDLARGIRAFRQVVKFAPYAAGATFSAADCAAVVHLPLVSMATKAIYGADVFADDPQVPAYLKMVKERPSVRKVFDDLKAFKPR